MPSTNKNRRKAKSDREIRIGILRGYEQSFPEGLLANINRVARETGKNMVADFMMIEGTRSETVSGYAVVLDRISHKMPFFRTVLKEIALSGAYIVNNPFWLSADEPFFDLSLAHKLGIATPRTILLPSHSHPAGMTSEAMRNLVFPLNWKTYFQHVKFPLWLKPAQKASGKGLYKVHTAEEFFGIYDRSGDWCMMMQEHIEYTEFYRCYQIGDEMRIMPYDPRKEPMARYAAEFTPSIQVAELIADATEQLCKGLGYDINMIEFAVKDGIPYAIDCVNPVPDMEAGAMGEENYKWILSTMTHFLIAKAEEAAENIAAGNTGIFPNKWLHLQNGKVEARTKKGKTSASK